MARWVNALRQDEAALEDFMDYLDKRKALAQRDQDEAVEAQHWSTVLEMNAQKKIVDELRGFVRMAQQEDESQARLRIRSR